MQRADAKLVRGTPSNMPSYLNLSHLYLPHS
jgi:hypothetical protein